MLHSPPRAADEKMDADACFGYLKWLRDDLKVFDIDATVKKEHFDRLDPDCLEVLDFNLSAGRHKPFVFDCGQHRPPAALIGELQGIHSEVQKRLARLLGMLSGNDGSTKRNVSQTATRSLV